MPLTRLKPIQYSLWFVRSHWFYTLESLAMIWAKLRLFRQEPWQQVYPQFPAFQIDSLYEFIRPPG